MSLSPPVHHCALEAPPASYLDAAEGQTPVYTTTSLAPRFHRRQLPRLWSLVFGG